ncbi:hypothetical protein HZC30_07515 [Candidatus Woesearchaeota archaeon]|nr:hypothetical protein [Candidatus Woesearchaeota archaeon]
MGRIKKIFSKKEEEPEVEEPPKPVIEEISLDQLPQWIKQREAETLSSTHLESELGNYLTQLKDYRWRLDNKLTRWQEEVDFSKLQYTSVGEINSLFSQAQGIVKLLNTKHPLNLTNISRFNRALKERTSLLLEKIEKGTFSEELLEALDASDNALSNGSASNPLWKEMIELNVLRDGFEQKFNDTGWNKIALLQRINSVLIDSAEELTQLGERININQQRIQDTKLSLKEKEHELAAFKEDKDYKFMEDRDKQLEQVTPALEDAKQKLLVFFSPLVPYLEKFSQSEPDNSLLQDYAQSFVQAFYEDDELMIMSVVRRLWMAINEGKFIVDDKDIALLRERVEQTNLGVLRKLHQDYCELRRKYLQIEQVVPNRSLQMKLDDLNYRLEHYQDELKRLNNVVAEIRKEIEDRKSLQLKAKERFRQVVGESWGKEVELRLG